MTIIERHVDHIHQRSRYFVTITNNQGNFIFQKQSLRTFFEHTGSNILKEILKHVYNGVPFSPYCIPTNNKLILIYLFRLFKQQMALLAISKKREKLL